MSRLFLLQSFKNYFPTHYFVLSCSLLQDMYYNLISPILEKDQKNTFKASTRNLSSNLSWKYYTLWVDWQLVDSWCLHLRYVGKTFIVDSRIKVEWGDINKTNVFPIGVPFQKCKREPFMPHWYNNVIWTCETWTTNCTYYTLGSGSTRDYQNILYF